MGRWKQNNIVLETNFPQPRPTLFWPGAPHRKWDWLSNHNRTCVNSLILGHEDREREVIRRGENATRVRTDSKTGKGQALQCPTQERRSSSGKLRVCGTWCHAVGGVRRRWSDTAGAGRAAPAVQGRGSLLQAGHPALAPATPTQPLLCHCLTQGSSLVHSRPLELLSHPCPSSGHSG